MSGYVKLHRGWRDNPALDTAERRDAWIWLLEHACWRGAKFNIKGKTVELERGQLVASREQLAKAWKWSPSAVERFLTRLQTEQMLGRETGQGKSVLTIVNYGKYQDRPSEAGQETEPETGQESDRDRTAKEEGKEEEEGKNTHYAFFGRAVRLTARDLDNWRKVYHGIPDVEAELVSLDAWLRGQPAKAQKDWFHIVAGALNKKHQAALAERRTEGGHRGIGI